ncbi:ABC transporter type 1, transmembrane domain [Dillenia turbinata]|uniref:ABC transporter type 1, transmembrane domain n=1 Tax=Dillenia turbinata TaxID=194707 RepID=A0AAN8ZMJ9_9MAGN
MLYQTCSSIKQRLWGVNFSGERKPEISYDTKGKTLRVIEANIEIPNKYFAYPSCRDKLILHGFSLSIPAGKFVVFVGSSRCRKSTVISLVARFDYHSKVNMEEEDEQIQKAASMANAPSFISHLPNQYLTQNDHVRNPEIVKRNISQIINRNRAESLRKVEESTEHPKRDDEKISIKSLPLLEEPTKQIMNIPYLPMQEQHPGRTTDLFFRLWFGLRKGSILQEGCKKQSWNVFNLLSLKGLLSLFAHTLQQYFYRVVGEKAMTNLRRALYSGVLRNEIGWFEKPENKVDSMPPRKISDTSMVKTIISELMSEIVQCISSILIATGVSLYVNWRLALVAWAVMPCHFIGGLIQAKAAKGFSVALWYTTVLIDQHQASFENGIKAYQIFSLTVPSITELWILIPTVISTINVLTPEFQTLDRKTEIEPDSTEGSNPDTISGDRIPKGKSSVISLLLRFYDPRKGKIMIDGEDLRGYNLRRMRTYRAVSARTTTF